MSKNFAVRFSYAVFELQNGHVERGLAELFDIYKNKEDMDVNLRAEVVYALGIGLLEYGDPSNALKVLNEYRDQEGYGSKTFQKIRVTVEISYAYIELGDFESAFIESQKAIDMMLETGEMNQIAYFSKGIAELGLKKLNDSEKDLKQALSIACENGDIVTAACACEHIGRTAF